MSNQYQSSYTATAATTVVSTGGLLELHTVNVPKATVGTLSYQDKNSNVYFALPTGTVGGSYRYDMTLADGLKIVQSSASDQITTTYKQP